MNIKEQKYGQFLQEIAEKEHRSMEEVKRFKDIRIGFDNGWDAALLSQWSDPSKELPKSRQQVLVYTINKVIMSAQYIPNKDGEPCWIHFPGFIANEDVTHWHPFPHPPED